MLDFKSSVATVSPGDVDPLSAGTETWWPSSTVMLANDCFINDVDVDVVDIGDADVGNDVEVFVFS